MTFDHATIYINFITVSIFYTQIMKKFFYLLLLLPLAMISTSCDDDDDKVPDVNISASITNGVVKDGVIYAVKGDTLIVDQITLVNNSGKEGTIGAVTYYWNHYLMGTAVVAPYTVKINPDVMPVGRHLLQATMPVYVVDYPVCFGEIAYPVQVVETADELPGTPDTPTVTATVSTQE